MASTPPLIRPVRKGISPASAPAPLRIASSAARSSLSDEVIWSKLKEAGFDEEMIKRRDKASLIAYITKLETELNDYQHQMGILLLEKKEWTSKYEEIKASADLAEITHKCDQTRYMSTINEAKKRQDTLKKTLEIEKECRLNIDKALQELRAECAEIKVDADIKLEEAQKIMADSQKKIDDAENKIRTAESLHAEAIRKEKIASRKLQEVETREDELRRRTLHSKEEWDARGNDLLFDKQSISYTQKNLQQEQEKLLEHQSLLNQREEIIFIRSQDLDQLEMKLDAAKENIDKELMSLKQEKSNLASELLALASREEVVSAREKELDRKEIDLIAMQNTLASKEQDEIQRLKSEFELTLAKRKSDFESELAQKREKVEAELDAKRKAFEIREADLAQLEKKIEERDEASSLQLNKLIEKEEDIAKKLQSIIDKEESASLAQKAADREMLELKREKQEIENMRMELAEAMERMEDEKREVNLCRDKLATSITESNDLLILEAKLKEEIDNFRAQKMELMAEADALKSEKEKFEYEWELIDEKKDKLQKEAERISEERNAAFQYIKNEHESLKSEKDALREQFKKDFESLSREKEDVIVRLEREHSELFCMIQHERDAFVEEIALQKRELEACIQKRQEEVEVSLKEKEEAFEKERAQEFQKINTQKEMIARDLENVRLEREKINNERLEIIEDRALRGREWSEIKSFIDVLNTQREKLQEQRELLVEDRSNIHSKIQHLEELQAVNLASENRALSESPSYSLKAAQRFTSRKSSNRRSNLDNGKEVLDAKKSNADHEFSGDLRGKISIPVSPSTSVSTWFRKCTDIFKRTLDAPFEANPPKIFANNPAICYGSPKTSHSGIEFSGTKFDKLPDSARVLVNNTPNEKSSNLLSKNSTLTSGTLRESAIQLGGEKCDVVTEQNQSIQSDSSSLPELNSQGLMCESHLTIDLPMTKKRPIDLSSRTGSTSHLDLIDKSFKKRKQSNTAEGIPIMATQDELGEPGCLDDNGVVMLEQDSVDKSIPKNQEELGVKELHSAGDAEIPQDVRTPLQSDNLFPRESAGNDLISSGLDVAENNPQSNSLPEKSV